MFKLLFRRIRFAWLWAVVMLIWRNRVAIAQALRSLYARIRGVQPPPQTVRSVQPTGRI
jgi:predicted LPLAT superfamily acyltransferase